MSDHSYDIIIIGGGITALSTRFHLEQAGISRIASIWPRNDVSSECWAQPTMSGGHPDNFTRLAHGFGMPDGRAIWSWGDDSFKALVRFARSQGISAHLCPRERLAINEHEAAELGDAQQLLATCGLSGKLTETAGAGSQQLSLRHENSGAWINPDEVRNALEPDQLIHTTDCTISEKPDGIEVSGPELQLHAEMVVCAAHLYTAQLVPELREVLIPYLDQWTAYSINEQISNTSTSVFSYRHGLEWGGIFRKTLVLGGGRFMRKLAGIGGTKPEYIEPIERSVAKNWSQLFGVDNLPAVLTPDVKRAVVEIRPCDEKPVVGPMFGSQRVLIAAGFLGQNMTQGFWAGNCLARLIDSGECQDLPRSLWPERLRSLGED